MGGSLDLRVALTLALATLAAVLAPSAALASETLVNFDNLTPGATVKAQYEAQGLKLGFASELGEPSPGEGDCGAPTVRGGSSPPSAPNYAELATCTGKAGPEPRGTYGALTAHPSGKVSVKVSDVTIGTPAIELELVLYDPSGAPIASASANAEPGSWSALSADAGAAHIGFFLLRSKKVVPAGEVGIDDLAFQTPEGPGEPPKEPPKEEPPRETPPPTPPTAVGQVLTANPHAGNAVALSGAGSNPGAGGRIVSYEWDFNGDGKVDTSTGANPIAHVLLPTGLHTIGLTVTNSNGEKSSSKFGVLLQGVSIPPPDGGEGPCQTSLEVVNAQLLGECIQKKGGEYVIETKQLGLNGMVFAAKGGGYGIFKVSSRRIFGVGTEYTLTGPTVNVELWNTPIGDMVLGARNLESEPADLGTAAEHRPVITLTAPFTAHAADEERLRNLKGTPLMAFGVGKPCKAGEKAVGCCPPPSIAKACATLPGNFPITGTVVVYLTNKGQALLDIQVGLNLSAVNFEATGELELLSSRETGVELTTLRFTIPEAALKPIFKVKEASFVYYFPGYPEPEKRDTWQAKATVTFGLLNEPGLEGELSFQHGQFHSAGMKLTLPPPGIPVYPGISLNRIGASVGIEPLEFGGSLGAKVASALELELAFKYSEEGGGHLGFFGGKGSLSYEENTIASLEGDVYSDGYSDALLQVKISVPFGSKQPVVTVEGEIGYWDESATGLWEAYGRIHAKLWVIEGEIAGIVNNKYIAGCGYLGPFGALGYWDFETSSPGGEGFVGGNCHDDLKPYKQVPQTQHTGGFVNETETERMRGRAARTDATIALAPAPLGRDLRITSASGTPAVTLTGPGGVSYTTPASAGKVSMSGTSFVSALSSDRHTAIVYLSAPAGGAWHLKRAPGSAPITSVEVAEVAPPPAIHGAVHHRGGTWSLAYAAKNLVAGTKLRLYERGRDGIQGLATVTAPSGLVRFTPTEALARRRTIYATVMAATGQPLETLTVASYSAPAPFRPGRPSRARFVRAGSSAILTWGAVSGARLYRVKVKGSDGRLRTFFAQPGSRRETLPNVLPSESFTATVVAVGGKDMLAGSPATARLAPVRTRGRGVHRIAHHR